MENDPDYAAIRFAPQMENSFRPNVTVTYIYEKLSFIGDYSEEATKIERYFEYMKILNPSPKHGNINFYEHFGKFCAKYKILCKNREKIYRL